MARRKHDSYTFLGFFTRLFRWIAMLFLALILLSVLLVASLRWINPPTSAFMLHHQIAGSVPLEYRWVDQQQISEYLAIAAVAAEDQRFLQHHGVDFTEIRRAWRDYRNGQRLRGASTITQQVAKNLFLWNSRSFPRKILELYFSAILELLLSKERILEVYLNIAEFGDGVYGVEQASRIYFSQSARSINLRQASLMMAVLPNPKVYNLKRPSLYHIQRARAIEKSTIALGGIQYLRQ